MPQSIKPIFPIWDFFNKKPFVDIFSSLDPFLHSDFFAIGFKEIQFVKEICVLKIHQYSVLSKKMAS